MNLADTCCRGKEHFIKPIRRWSDQEIVDGMQSFGVLNEVRKLFSFGSARIEQAMLQKKPPSSVELRRMEFEIAQDIIVLFKEFEKA